MKIAVGSDHGGIHLKNHIREYLTAKGIEVLDCIGLSLSLKIISTYGGQMGIHSEEGHFTTVSITFPLSLAEE